ncbi:MAG: hypothetical protein AAGG48_18145 [Planctomycetota bacterium]
MNHDEDWFLMMNERKPNYARSAWVPLFIEEQIETGRYPEIGYADDYFGVGTMLLDADESKDIRLLDWPDVRPSSHRPGFNADGFYSAKSHFSQVHGQYLVFPISDEGKEAPRQVLIDPDLILGLRLHPIGSDWISFRDDRELAIRQASDDAGNVTRVEIRSEYLKDYLAAREMGLAVITLRERKQVFVDRPVFQLSNEESTELMSWSGGIGEIDEYGGSFGSTWTVTVVGRHDVDAREDAPVADYEPEDEELSHRNFETAPGESKRFLISGDLIKREWISPAPNSPRVRGDDPNEVSSFIADAASTRMTSAELEEEPRWRWLTFRPEGITHLLDSEKILLEWWSRQTGCFRYGDKTRVPFGVNPNGLVCIFSKDVIELAPHRQRHFSGHSVAPDGGACEELIQAQMQNQPADTVAPEARILTVRENLNNVFAAQYGNSLFRPNQIVKSIAARTDRFAASNAKELYDLAKDLRRIFVESIDDAFLKSLTTSCPDEHGSIKRIKKLLDDVGQDGRSMTSALAGIHDLRQASAHLPRSSVDASFSLVKVELSDPVLVSAMNMIEAVVDSIDSIAKALEARP